MTLRYGIIGTGMMGCEHIRNLAAMDDVDVSLVLAKDQVPEMWKEDRPAPSDPRHDERWIVYLETFRGAATRCPPLSSPDRRTASVAATNVTIEMDP